MYYYRELTLLPDVEVTENFLWSKLFYEVHHALAEGRKQHPAMNIGCSWPEYKEESLGKKLRLIAASRADLESLPLEHHLARYDDYCRLTSIRPVGDRRIRGYALYRRYQPDGAADRKARRYIRRHPEVSFEEAQRLLKQKERKFLPFIQMESESTGQKFSLFIEKIGAKEAPPGEAAPFSTYGLSASTAVPEF